MRKTVKNIVNECNLCEGKIETAGPLWIDKIFDKDFIAIMKNEVRNLTVNKKCDVVLEKCSNGEGDFGYDADAGVYGQLLEKGIMDPAKVTRAAIENAASVAAMVLTTESLITDIKEPEPPMPAAPPMDY